MRRRIVISGFILPTIDQFTGSHGGNFLEHHSCVSRTNTIYSVKTRTESIFEVREINANANVIEFHDIAG